MWVLETERLGRVREGGDDALMQCLDLLETGGEELSLWRRAFVHTDSDENLAEECEDARGIIEAGDECRLAVRLWEVRTWRDAASSRDKQDEKGAGIVWLNLGDVECANPNSLFVVQLSWEVARGIFVPQTDRPPKQDRHGLVRCRKEELSFSAPIEKREGITAKEQPKRPPAHLAFNKVETLVRRFFMHP